MSSSVMTQAIPSITLSSSSTVMWPAVTRVFTIFGGMNRISSGEMCLVFSRREL